MDLFSVISAVFSNDNLLAQVVVSFIFSIADNVPNILLLSSLPSPIMFLFLQTWFNISLLMLDNVKGRFV